ncbi:MAG: translation initiation factor eIF-2B [Dehalococcoidales bacterium]|nr:translation initiation factor eIF-2B [Dehalococcoidales bacterium]
MNISSKINRLTDEIRNDKTQGASQLARQAMAVLKVAAEHSQADSAEHFLEELKGVGKGLMEARPAMAPIFNIVNRYLVALSLVSPGQGVGYLKGLAVSKADELARVSLQAIAEITSCGLGLIAEGDKIMTHSYSSTVMAVLGEAPAEGKRIEVIVTRSGAGGTGQRIALELGRRGMKVTFIDDTAVGLYVSSANKVMVGADRVCADGTIVNGVGTYLLALAAQKAAIPFYVLCETLKFDHRMKSDEVDLEEKEPSEVIGRVKLPPQVSVKNPYFDLTPLELVTGIVTENGLLAPGGVTAYIRRLLSAKLG